MDFKIPDEFVVGYGLDFADRLVQVDKHEDALPILISITSKDPSSKLAYRKLAEVNKEVDDLLSAAKAYEE